MSRYRTTAMTRWAVALASAVALAACGDKAPAPITGPSTRLPGGPVYGAVATGSFSVGDGVASPELFQVCKVWAPGVTPTDIQVRLQVSGGVTKDTVFTITPTDGRNAQNQPIQCRVLWVNSRAEPSDNVTATELTPTTGYTTTWTVQTVLNPARQGIFPGPSYSGTGTVAQTVPIGANPNNAGALVTFTNTPIPPGALGDFVWSDLNNNGLQDANEPGIPNVPMNLLQNNVVVATTTTNGSGIYSFPNLAPGNYTVCVATPPAGFNQTYPSTNCTNATVVSGVTDNSLDFGYYQPAGLGDRVWSDDNGNGLQDNGENGISGVTVTVTSNNVTVATLTTGANGLYGIGNLPPGNYTVCVSGAPIAGLVQSYDLDGVGTPNCATASLIAGQNRTDVDFGFYKTASVGDFVWYDMNGNGIQDGNEPGISGATVTITGPGVSLSTTTSGAGAYGFVNLAPGTYTVCVAIPASYTGASPAGQGGNGATDSNGSGAGNCASVTLASGDVNSTIDFGFVRAKASVGDFVWHDLNANGIQDNGEPGIAGATVMLTGANGTQTATTNGSGAYSFVNLEPGTYTVCTAVPSGFAAASAANQGNNAALDSDGSGANNCASVTLAAGENNTAIDFGFYKKASVGDFVWYDVNGNGIQDAGEPGISGATVSITGPNGTQSTTTSGTGAYSFSNLTPGTYSVCVAIPASYTGASPAGQGGNGATDSNGSGTGNCASVTLASGDVNNTIDFGFVRAKASVGDFVWNDLNANGIQDAGEPGIGGATVTLTGPSGPLTTTTSGTGAYSFTNLEPGTYTVCTAVPSGFAAASAANQGNNAALDSDGSGANNCASVTLGAGENNTSIDFGFYKTGSIGDRVWNDANGNGVQDNGEAGLNGWTVTIRNAANQVVGTATTSGDGNYTFNGLIGGTYSVCATALAGYTQTYDLDGISSANCASVTLADGQNRTDVDFGYVQLGSIGDRVWNDANANGVQDNGEAGLNGWTVTIRNAANQVVGTATTSGDGNYSFGGLVAGTYSVCATPLAGYTQTYDLDGISSANCASATLAAGQNRTDVDFGYVQLGSIGDRVWNDANANGVQDNGEAGLNGWTVTIRNAANQVVGTATTSGNGNYSFGSLVAGTYSVCATPLAGYTQTYDLDGIGTANCASVTLAAGQNRTDVDFGYRVPPIVAAGSIGNYTWIDANGNGKQDAGEPVLNGVSLALGGAASATTTSAGSGSYLFSGLAAGSYTVTATAPAGFGFTTVNAFGTNSGNDSNGSPSAVTLATNSSTDLTIDFGFVKLGGGGEGCSPGYWKQSQHFDSWKWYTTTDQVDAVYGVTFRSTFKQNPSGPLSLLDALNLQGNNNGEQLFRQGTAVLLNSVYQSGLNSPYSAAQVIQMVRDAWLSGDAAKIAAAEAKLAAATALTCKLN